MVAVLPQRRHLAVAVLFVLIRALPTRACGEGGDRQSGTSDLVVTNPRCLHIPPCLYLYFGKHLVNLLT